jgi:hypothetical protein
VVSFTPLPLCPRGKSRRYPSDRRLGGPQSRFGRLGEEKILHLTGTRTPIPRSSSPQPVAIRTTLSRLLKTVYNDEKNLNSGVFLRFLINRPGFRDKPQRPGLHPLNQDVVAADSLLRLQNFSLAHAIRRAQENINGTNQLLIYDGENLLGRGD